MRRCGQRALRSVVQRTWLSASSSRVKSWVRSSPAAAAGCASASPSGTRGGGAAATSASASADGRRRLAAVDGECGPSSSAPAAAAAAVGARAPCCGSLRAAGRRAEAVDRSRPRDPLRPRWPANRRRGVLSTTCGANGNGVSCPPISSDCSRGQPEAARQGEVSLTMAIGRDAGYCTYLEPRVVHRGTNRRAGQLDAHVNCLGLVLKEGVARVGRRQRRARDA